MLSCRVTSQTSCHIQSTPPPSAYAAVLDLKGGVQSARLTDWEQRRESP